jgi:hypothetical protein
MGLNPLGRSGIDVENERNWGRCVVGFGGGVGVRVVVSLRSIDSRRSSRNFTGLAGIVDSLDLSVVELNFLRVSDESMYFLNVDGN